MNIEYISQIHFNVKDNSGKVIYYLQEEHSRFNCMGTVYTPNGKQTKLMALIHIIIVTGSKILNQSEIILDSSLLKTKYYRFSLAPVYVLTRSVKV